MENNPAKRVGLGLAYSERKCSRGELKVDSTDLGIDIQGQSTREQFFFIHF
jgi:hypothetical protein